MQFFLATVVEPFKREKPAEAFELGHALALPNPRVSNRSLTGRETMGIEIFRSTRSIPQNTEPKVRVIGVMSNRVNN